LLENRIARRGLSAARLFVVGLGLCVAVMASACTRESDAEAATASSPSGRRDPKPNVVLISVDTLRADHLGLYGYRRPTSPELEALASEGVVFDHFIQNGGGTLPSHMTMMTSLRPAVHGLSARRPGRLPDARITLAEQLRSNGYATAAWTDGGWVRAKFGFDQGFDIFDDSGGRLRTTLPKAETWIRKHRGSPFFVFLHTYDVHSQRGQMPYTCPGDYPESFAWPSASTFDGCRSGRCATDLLKWVNAQADAGELDPHAYFSPAEVELMRAMYDGCIRYVDHEIGRLMALLHDLGIYDRTLVVVTADHGEEFLDHGRFLHVQGGYENMAHVPLVMKLPGSVKGGGRVEPLAAMVDLMPTILGIAHIRPNPEAEGHSLLPAIFEGRPIRSYVTMYSTIRSERWKLFRNPRRLFDIVNDPEETHNVVARYPHVVKQLEARLRRILEADSTLAKRLQLGIGPAPLTKNNLRELRALGYL
jgi:arylsulfatase A-like enzyme